MSNDWLAEILGTSKPKKHKTLMQEAGEFCTNAASALGVLAIAFQIGSLIFEKKK